MENVLFVIGSLSYGGAERVTSTLAEQFIKEGFKVSVVTVYDQKNSYLENSNIKLYSIRHNYRNRFLRAVNIILGLKKLIRSEKPDIIISFVWQVNIYSILACMFYRNIKLVISERNDPYRDPNNIFLRKIRDVLYHFSNGYVFQTEDAKNYFSDDIQKRGTVISNPIKNNLPFWKNNNSKVIITACRLAKQKNLPMMIDAFEMVQKEYPDYKLKIFGEGPLRKELEDYIVKKGLEKKVLLPGFSENIHQEMVNAEIFVISSDYEGISNSMLEALAIGIPVISTDSPIGGARMFIKNYKNGILVDVGNTEQLAKAMKKLISDKEFAVSLSNESRKIREILSTDKIANKWIQYLTYIFGEKYENKNNGFK